MVSAPAPLVSIAIRAYRRRWLHEAIDSVLSQTHSDLELVLYDDAGDLEDVARTYADPRLRYHRATARYGPSGRFLAAAALCRGRYLGMLDDDDRYEPTFVERLVGVLERDSEVGVAFCRTTWQNDHTRHVPFDPRPEGRQPHAAADMIGHGRIVTPSLMLMRRSALDATQRAHPMPDGVAPDLFLNVGLAVTGWQHWLVDEHLSICRWHSGQLSRRFPSARDVAIATWQALPLDDAALAKARQSQLARTLLLRALERLQTGDTSGARTDLASARHADPRR